MRPIKLASAVLISVSLLAAAAEAQQGTSTIQVRAAEFLLSNTILPGRFARSVQVNGKLRF
jgi:hypothetical protein